MVTNMDKLENLYSYLKNLGKVAVAYSGGVDSAFLLKACVMALGCDNVIALTANASASPMREIDESSALCENLGVTQIKFDFDQMSVYGFCDNLVDRCYTCKKALFMAMKTIAKAKGFEYVAEGSNLDDDFDYRPGHLAIAQLDIKSPLRDNQLSKAEIRLYSRDLGLKTWSKPSMACLATRFEYGEKITLEKLQMIDKAENELVDLGFSQVRVRVHGNIARIEILKDEMNKILPLSDKIDKDFKALGFDYVSVDLAGYKQGSMNINIG